MSVILLLALSAGPLAVGVAVGEGQGFMGAGFGCLCLRAVLSASWIGAVALAGPSPAVAEEPAPNLSKPGGAGAEAAGLPGAPDASALNEALDRARSTNTAVEVWEARSSSSTVWANPDGSVRVEESLGPIRVKKDGAPDHGWAAIDTNVSVVSGRVVPAAVHGDLSFSNGGAGPLVELGIADRKVALSWSGGALPAPVLSGESATYPEVFPDVDLVVRARPAGFQQLLVVKTPEAAANPALREISLGWSGQGWVFQENTRGGLDVFEPGSQGLVATGAPLRMWDSSDQPAASAKLAGDSNEAAVERRWARVDLQVDRATTGSNKLAEPTGLTTYGGGTLSVTPDQQMLTDPDTVYPVTIDPGTDLTVSRSHYAFVSKHFAGSNFLDDDLGDPRGIGMGYRIDDDYPQGDTKRAFYQFAVSSKLHGKQILGASLFVYNTHSWSCNARAMKVHLSSAIGSGTTWNNQPSLGAELASRSFAHGYSSSCPDSTEEFNVTSAAADAAAANWKTVTFRLSAADESDVFGWKRFSVDAAKTKLTVTYNSIPGKPAASGMSSDPGGKCSTNSAAPQLSKDNDFELSAMIKDADKYARARFELWALNSDGSLGAQSDAAFSAFSADPGLASSAGFGVSSSRRLVGAMGTATVKRFVYRARGEDGMATSAWSSWCYLKVDTAAPPPPTVASPRYERGVWNDGLGITGHFTFTSNSSDVVAYEYRFTWPDGTGGSVDEYPWTRVTAGSDAQHTRSVLYTPMGTAWNHAYVRTVDAVGNKSAERDYPFLVRWGLPPNGWWPMDDEKNADGTEPTSAADVSGGTNPLALNATAFARSGGRVRGALTGSSESAYGTATGVVSGTASFAISTWAKLDAAEAGSYVELVSLAGEVQSPMRLYYSPTSGSANGATNGAWVFARADSDALNTTWTYAISNATPLVGRWTHLMATWDQATGEMSLYVNGAKQTLDTTRTFASSKAWPTTRGMQVGRAMLNDLWHKSPAWEVDEVQAYNRALAPSEIAALFAQARNQVGTYQFQDAAALGKDTPTGAGSTRTALRGLTPYGQTSQADGFGVPNSTKALQLDGVGDYLASSDGKPVVDTGDSWSVSVWTTLTSRPTSFQPLVAQCGQLECGFALGYFGQDDTWRLMLPQGDSTTAPTIHMVSSAEPPELGQRVLLTATYDAFNRVARIYVDGNSQAYGGGSVCDTLDCADADDGLGTPWAAGGAFNIGKWIHNNDTSYWSGLIDDVYVYQGLLVDRDVSELAAANAAP